MFQQTTNKILDKLFAVLDECTVVVLTQFPIVAWLLTWVCICLLLIKAYLWVKNDFLKSRKEHWEYKVNTKKLQIEDKKLDEEIEKMAEDTKNKFKRRSEILEEERKKLKDE